MFVLKAILTGLVGIMILAALVATWLFVQFEVYYPWKYKRYAQEAVEWNAQHWQNGPAKRVVVQISADSGLGGESSEAEVYCFNKMFAIGGGVKGPPGRWKANLQKGPATLSVAFGPDARALVLLRNLCHDVFRNEGRWILPETLENGHFWSAIVANDRSFQCFTAKNPHTSLGKVTPLVIRSIDEVQMHSVMTKSRFDDLLSYDNDNVVIREAPQLAWHEGVTGKAGWRFRKDAAVFPNSEKICGRPIGKGS